MGSRPAVGVRSWEVKSGKPTMAEPSFPLLGQVQVPLTGKHLEGFRGPACSVGGPVLGALLPIILGERGGWGGRG